MNIPTAKLRPYQKEAVQHINDGWADGAKRQLCVMPTGTGKTIMFGAIALENLKRNASTLIIAHTNELVQQARDKIYKMTGKEYEPLVEMATSNALQWCKGESLVNYHDTTAHIVIGSVQSLRGDRLASWPQDYFDTIIIDEAHRTLATSYTSICDHFHHACVLGVTATPDRGDKRNLGKFYERIAYEYDMIDATAQGYLSPIKCHCLPIEIDLKESTHGDYDAEEVGAAIEPVLPALAKQVAEAIGNRKSIAFLPLRQISKDFVDALNWHGVKAVHVDGDSKDRTQILQDFDAGKYQLISNAMLLTEGYDCPSIECVIPLRPTKIRALYAQMIGRGTRIHPGKEYLLVLDFLWHSMSKSLCRPAHLVAYNEEEAEQITNKLMQRAHGGDDDIDLFDAKAQASEERMAKLAQKLKDEATKRKHTARVINPLEWALSIHDDNLAEYEPTLPWELKPVTPKQYDMLERNGFDMASIDTCGKASFIIDKLIARRNKGMCSPKQARFLTSLGIQDASNYTFAAASTIIDDTINKNKSNAV